MMTEMEWLESLDPTQMLDFLEGNAIDRKLRLFGVACCRSIWHLLTDEQSRTAGEVAELYADGGIGLDLLQRAVKEVPLRTPIEIRRTRTFKGIDADMSDPRTFVCLTAIPEVTPQEMAIFWAEYGQRFVPVSISSEILRELFGNPFRPVLAEPGWFTSTVVALTMGIYEERAFERMPILADALQESGCENDDILHHCRQPRTHFRGCWVVDLLLRKTQQ